MNQKTNQKYGVGRILTLVVLGIVLGVSIYLLFATVIGGNQMPMPFGYGVGVVSSGSMEPKLSIDDLIIVKQESSYAVGDVVVFQSGKILVVHEIISIDEQEEMAVTQGCANTGKDAPIRLRDIKGKVVFCLPKIGFLVFLMKTLGGQLLILAAAIFLLWYSWARQTKREEQEHDQAVEEIRREISRLKSVSQEEKSTTESSQNDTTQSENQE